MENTAKILNINPVFPVRDMRETMDYYVYKSGFMKAFEDKSAGIHLIIQNRRYG